MPERRIAPRRSVRQASAHRAAPDHRARPVDADDVHCDRRAPQYRQRLVPRSRGHQVPERDAARQTRTERREPRVGRGHLGGQGLVRPTPPGQCGQERRIHLGARGVQVQMVEAASFDSLANPPQTVSRSTG